MVVAAKLASQERDRDGGCENKGGRARVGAPATARRRYQPETAHTSLLSRAASAPAAALKSPPESRKA